MPKDSAEELHDRLMRHGGAIGRVEVGWNAADGGPRMTVTLKGRDGRQIDAWEDWMIFGEDEPGRRGTDIIERVIRMTLGEQAIAGVEAGWFQRSYAIRET